MLSIGDLITGIILGNLSMLMICWLIFKNKKQPKWYIVAILIAGALLVGFCWGYMQAFFDIVQAIKIDMFEFLKQLKAWM